MFWRFDFLKDYRIRVSPCCQECVHRWEAGLSGKLLQRSERRRVVGSVPASRASGALPAAAPRIRIEGS